jgi:thiamine biosynthesis lipoprotein
MIPALLVLACSAPLVAHTRFEYSEVAMGVRARIVLYAKDEATAHRAAQAAYDRIAYLEDIMSDYRPASELSRLSAKSGGPAVKITPELLFILTKSQDLSRRSDGAFDVTVGPVVKLWRTARKSGQMPTKAELDAARKLVGWRKVHLDAKAGTVKLDTPGMELDLGGIAKGYACDEAIRVLKQRGIASALVEMGGDIVVSAAPPGKKGWQIEIANATVNCRGEAFADKPVPVARSVRECFAPTISNAAVSSSGDTEQYVEIGGKRYSHIVDPRTGLGLTDRIAVTVVAPNGVTSDGLSTAISVLGAKRGKTLANTYPGVTVYIRRAH